MMRRLVVMGLVLVALSGQAHASSKIIYCDYVDENPAAVWWVFFEMICEPGPIDPIFWGWVYPEINDSIIVFKQGKYYKFDPTTGRVGAVPPLAALTSKAATAQGVGANAAVTDTTGRFVYVVRGGSDQIAGYRVDPVSGERTDLPGAPYKAGRVPSSLAVHPSNGFLFASNSISDTISVFRLDPVTGALSAAGTIGTGPLPRSVAVHPSGQYLYVTTVSGSAIPPAVQAFHIDSTTGALAPVGAPLTTGNFPDSVAVHPAGRFLYLVSTVQVEGYAIADNGTLTKVSGSPFPAPNARHLLIAASGRFLYTVNPQSDTVSGFGIDLTTGTLSPVPGSPFASGANPSSIIDAAGGRFIVVGNTGSLVGRADSVSVFGLQPATGTLVPVADSPFATEPGVTPDVLVVAPVRQSTYAAAGTLMTRTFAGTISGTSPRTWSVERGALPAGLALDAKSATVAGVPTTPGNYEATLKVVDAAGQENRVAVAMTVNATGTPGGLPLPTLGTAIEYFHAGFGHYFVTHSADEIIKLDTGFFGGWARTGRAFNVHAGSAGTLVPVCRFFTVAFPPSSSHFYAPRGLGCEGTLADPNWQFEGDIFYTALPEANGTCPAGEQPIYRLYNDGQGGAPNHRFTTSPVVRAQMLAQKYIAEGTGVGVGMCAPQ